MSSSYYEHLIAWDEEQRRKLGTHITCHIGKEAEKIAEAERKARHDLSIQLGKSVELDETGHPKNLPLLETFCKNVYDAPLDQDPQTPSPLADRLFEIRETVADKEYPVRYRNRIIEIFTTLIHHAYFLDNCTRNQLGITIEALKMANQRTALQRS